MHAKIVIELDAPVTLDELERLYLLQVRWQFRSVRAMAPAIGRSAEFCYRKLKANKIPFREVMPIPEYARIEKRPTLEDDESDLLPLGIRR